MSFYKTYINHSLIIQFEFKKNYFTGTRRSMRVVKMLAVFFIFWDIIKNEDTSKKTIHCEAFSHVFLSGDTFKLFNIASGLKFEVWLSFFYDTVVKHFENVKFYF